jgi:hypothetical protein
MVAPMLQVHALILVLQELTLLVVFQLARYVYLELTVLLGLLLALLLILV